jgi:hypothetical protein
VNRQARSLIAEGVAAQVFRCLGRPQQDHLSGRLEGQAIIIKYFFLFHLLQPTLAPRIIRTSMTANNILFLNQQEKQF